MLTKLVSITLYLVLLITPNIGAAFETEHLIIRDITGSIPAERLGNLALRTESTLIEVIKFWSAEPMVVERGKIIVEFDHPLNKDVDASFFLWRNEKGKMFRVVKVYGGKEFPHQLAHKLTSALFPHPDILIRNMMGEASEMRFGNPQSFPMCGFSKDEWVFALLQLGSHIPIEKLGREQTDWGKEIINNTPRVTDRVKQHICYLEAGSFGEFLIDSYGTEKMKRFYQLSKQTHRPWEEVFGVSVDQLETSWLDSIKLKLTKSSKNIPTIMTLWGSNPSSACFSAQAISAKKLSK